MNDLALFKDIIGDGIHDLPIDQNELGEFLSKNKRYADQVSLFQNLSKSEYERFLVINALMCYSMGEVSYSALADEIVRLKSIVPGAFACFPVKESVLYRSRRLSWKEASSLLNREGISVGPHSVVSWSRSEQWATEWLLDQYASDDGYLSDRPEKGNLYLVLEKTVPSQFIIADLNSIGIGRESEAEVITSPMQITASDVKRYYHQDPVGKGRMKNISPSELAFLVKKH